MEKSKVSSKLKKEKKKLSIKQEDQKLARGFYLFVLRNYEKQFLIYRIIIW
jgi:hypothetical protein